MEIKNVREWFKVTARTYQSSPVLMPYLTVSPAPVEVLKGKDHNVFEFTSKTDSPLTSVVFAMVEGKEREALFKYPSSGVSIKMIASWETGAPQATLRFESSEGN
jgi:hypothetical protein